MNRDALLVYLRDLRDLELAKLSLPAAPARGAAALLQDAYALDLIPTSYRNLAFIYYLYDTMSTSLATMEDALRPEQRDVRTEQLFAQLEQTPGSEKERGQYAQIQTLHWETARFFAKLA